MNNQQAPADRPNPADSEHSRNCYLPPLPLSGQARRKIHRSSRSTENGYDIARFRCHGTVRQSRVRGRHCLHKRCVAGPRGCFWVPASAGYRRACTGPGVHRSGCWQQNRCPSVRDYPAVAEPAVPSRCVPSADRQSARRCDNDAPRRFGCFTAESPAPPNIGCLNRVGEKRGYIYLLSYPLSAIDLISNNPLFLSSLHSNL